MANLQLRPRILNKVWGRRDLLGPFSHLVSSADPVGEIWFEHPDVPTPGILVKHIFTSEQLSVQVHPDAAAGRAAGLAGGKDEAWFVVDADEGAVIALGPKRTVSVQELRNGAVKGDIEDLLDWRRVKPGDFLYSPATTIHAIGAGVSLIEVQENLDTTYRLFDYGRNRELHLEEGLAVADLQPRLGQPPAKELAPGRAVLAHGGQFVVERWTAPLSVRVHFDQQRAAWVIPLTHGAKMDDEQLEPCSAWVIQSLATITLSANADLLIAYLGSEIGERIEILQA